MDFTSSQNKIILKVSQINQQISQTLEKNFSSVWVQGEISNLIRHGSGHWYFSLKEENAQIKIVMFKGYNQYVRCNPSNGMEVVIQGEVNVYAPRGTYQILCKKIEEIGQGDLQKQFEILKKKLKDEGLFESSHKKAIPRYPKHIAIISSPTGAAIRDVLQILKRRSIGLKITLVPAVVQGEEAPLSLLKALDQAQKLSSIDTIIITRGGGSMEDLYGFNDETLARAIAKCTLPVISAVGHEIDFTIADFVADLRAPTPSAAAELVVKNSQDLEEQILKIKKQIIQSVLLQIKYFKQKLESFKRQLISPERLLQEKAQKIDELSLALSRSIQYILEKEKLKLKTLEKVLSSLNPKQVMQRGFCIASSTDGSVITHSEKLQLGDALSLEFFKGTIETKITKKIK